jgi:hypothetical protein
MSQTAGEVNVRPRILTESAAPDEVMPTQWGTTEYRQWCRNEANRQAALGVACQVRDAGAGRIRLVVLGPLDRRTS